MKLWTTVLLLPFATLLLLEHRGTSAFLIVVQSHRCGRGAANADGHFVNKRDASTQDGSGSHIENCTETLDSALLNITSHTTVLLEAGNYTIGEFILVHDATNITLEAEDNGDAVLVQCTKDAGLAFINVSFLSLRNIVIDGCGFTGTDIESTVDLLDDIVNIFYIIPRVVRIALLLGHCENMTMEHVTVMNTRGFGLVGINVIGTSQLRNVTFFNNTNPEVCLTNVSVNPTYTINQMIEYDSLNQLTRRCSCLLVL